MNIIVIGPPGSGKGTQAIQLAEKYGCKHISTGDLIREACKKDDPFSQKLKELHDKGVYASDDIVLELVKNNLAHDCNIFDGYPRTLEQAEALDEGVQIDLVIELEVGDDVTIERLLARKRADDNEEVIKKRLATYHDITEPLLEYYRPRNIVYKVDGVGTVEKVFERMCKVMETADVQTQ